MNPSNSALNAPTSVRWRIVGLMMTFSFMTLFNRVSISTIATDLIHEFHISETQMEAIVSSMLLPYTLFMTPGGWLSDRWGPRAALMLMGFGSASFVALTALGGHPLFGAGFVLISFMLIRACMGAFTAPVFPATGRMISHWFCEPLPLAQVR